LFLFYALFSKPGLFRRYILIDGWDAGMMQYVDQYVDVYSDLPARLYIGMVNNSPHLELVQAIKTLEARKFENLVIEYDLLTDIGQFAVPAEGLTKGLVWVFTENKS
jgi:hypothetical protein